MEPVLENMQVKKKTQLADHVMFGDLHAKMPGENNMKTASANHGIMASWLAMTSPNSHAE